jgi:uncharacterized protein (TIGR00251 family)
MIVDGPDGATLAIRVVPRAGRTALAGVRNGALLIRLAAAPVDGAANAELLAFLARLLDLPRQRLVLVAGDKARSKRVRVLGLSAATLGSKIDDLVHGR